MVMRQMEMQPFNYLIAGCEVMAGCQKAKVCLQ